MNSIWTHEINSILSVGYPMNGIGTNNWALAREDAINAIEKLGDIGVAILGGDVLCIEGENIRYSYDNWLCNRDDDESDFDFKNKSIAISKNHITNYKKSESGFLFAIVPKAPPSMLVNKDPGSDWLDRNT
jgi:hypothetical protein